jgi:hypothetical protein
LGLFTYNSKKYTKFGVQFKTGWEIVVWLEKGKREGEPLTASLILILINTNTVHPVNGQKMPGLCADPAGDRPSGSPFFLLAG